MNKNKKLLRLLLTIPPIQDILYPLCAPSEIYTLIEIVNIKLSKYEVSNLLNPMNEITKNISIPPLCEPIVYSPFLPEAIERIKNPTMLHRGKPIHLRIAYIGRVLNYGTDINTGNLSIRYLYKFINCYSASKFNISKSIVCSSRLPTFPAFPGDWITENLKKIHKTWNIELDNIYYMKKDGKVRTLNKISRQNYFAKDDNLAIHIRQLSGEYLYCVYFNDLY